jgi:hypothetical protein
MSDNPLAQPYRSSCYGIMRVWTFVGIALSGLAACGGGGDGGESGADRYQLAIDQADQAEATARALEVPSPCQQDQQCGLLTFLEPTQCPSQTYQVYSLISATATAAASAASDQVTLAHQAIALNPNPPQPCPLFPIKAPPTPVCTSNSCQAAM